MDMTNQQYGSSVSFLDGVLEGQIKKIKPANLVDFGAGAGKVGKLTKESLGDYCKLIAVEGCEKTAKMLSELGGVYHEVQHTLLQNWFQVDSKRYELAVFGDVLEHLSPKEIHQVVHGALQKFENIIIITPLHDIFQDEAYGNPLEIHKTYITSRFFDRYKPMEKHIYREKNLTIMNVRISTDIEADPFYRRICWFGFHSIMIMLQPIGLARPFVNFLKRYFLRFKWIIRG